MENALYAKFVSLNENKSADQCMLVLGLSGTPFVATLLSHVVKKVGGSLVKFVT